MKASLFFALLLAGGAVAQEPLLTLEPSPVQVPMRIGPLVANPSPHRYEQPGMGVAYQFAASGTTLTAYVYDADLTDLADGADTIPACIEYEVAKQGVQQAYQKPRLVSEYTVKLLPPEETPRMREAVFEFEKDGHAVVSYVWITTVAGKFIKLRFTADARLRDELPEARRAILTTFGEAIRPHLAPVDPQAKKPGATINLNLDLVNGDYGTAGMMYTMYLSALADQSPDAMPVCGGEFVPPYETELSLYRTLFVEDEEGAGTKFGRQIAKADSKGFLEELIWVELHRDGWSDQPPEGLTLPEYAQWKKKNLKRFHRPDLGTVALGYPRPLPEAPALE